MSIAGVGSTVEKARAMIRVGIVEICYLLIYTSNVNVFVNNFCVLFFLQIRLVSRPSQFFVNLNVL